MGRDKLNGIVNIDPGESRYQRESRCAGEMLSQYCLKACPVSGSVETKEPEKLSGQCDSLFLSDPYLIGVLGGLIKKIYEYKRAREGAVPCKKQREE